MGNRLHVAKKHDVQYASLEHFNWQIEEFHQLLKVLEVSFTGDEYDSDFEVSKEDWTDAITKLKSPTEEINEALGELGITASECIVIFSEYLSLSDPDNPYMWFSFF